MLLYNPHQDVLHGHSTGVLSDMSAKYSFGDGICRSPISIRVSLIWATALAWSSLAFCGPIGLERPATPPATNPRPAAAALPASNPPPPAAVETPPQASARVTAAHHAALIALLGAIGAAVLLGFVCFRKRRSVVPWVRLFRSQASASGERTVRFFKRLFKRPKTTQGEVRADDPMADYEYPLSTSWSLHSRTLGYFDVPSSHWLNDPRDTHELVPEFVIEFLSRLRKTVPRDQFREISVLPYAQSVLKFHNTYSGDDVVFKKIDGSLVAVVKTSRIEVARRTYEYRGDDAAVKTALMLLGINRRNWSKCFEAASVVEQLTNGQQVFGDSVRKDWQVPVTVVTLPGLDDRLSDVKPLVRASIMRDAAAGSQGGITGTEIDREATSLQDSTTLKPQPSANQPATIPKNNALGPKKASPQISCPKCGASMIYTAAKCQRCGNRMIKI
jgi:predicted RNA-binding Zn-ribbon protein involved in translation (DUF1610 family)